MTIKQEPIQRAIDFARPFHEETQPGYFDDHVMAVYRGVRLHSSDDNVLTAALFHDLIEDTKCKPSQVLEEFGYPVLWLVDSVTDEEGTNRQERKWKTYHKTRRSQYGVLIKLEDRLDNLRRCLRDPEAKYSNMYVKEDYSFRCGLWHPNEWPAIWDTYTDLIDLLKRQAARSSIRG